jgi:plastocyanin
MALTRRRLAVAMAALAAGTGAAYAVAGSAAGAGAPSTASVTAIDFDWVMPGGPAYTATIAAGGTVSFSYPSGVSIHNVDFTAGGPTACTQTAGAASGATSPLPNLPEAPGWAGVCRFDSPGTFLFVCDEHNYMKGTIVVEPNGGGTTGGSTGGGATSTGSSGSSGGSGGGSTAPTGGTSSSGSSASPAARPRVTVAHRQRGATVRGTVTTPAGRSRIKVTAYLAGHRRAAIGAQTRTSAGTGATAFAVRIGAAARRSLARSHRLAVALRIVVTPMAGGAPTTTTVAVALRDR